MVQRLEKAGILVSQGGYHRTRYRLARRYITGGWLEELAYRAILEAGADEARGRSRDRALMARASVLDVDIVGRDFFTWDRLVAALRDH